MAERARPYVLPLLGSLVVAALCIARILERAGEPALPLDDSFIHLQYAKRLAAGHWFSYAPGDGYSSGATSLLWPAAVAPFFWLGLRDLELVWVVWLLGTLLHAAVALEAARLGAGLAGRGAGLAAGALCMVFGAHAWFAMSGMETMALAWMLARGARVASELCEGPQRWLQPFSTRPPSRWQLSALGMLAPLVRPEGALVSAMALIVGLRWRRERAAGWRRAAWIALPLCGPLLLPAMHRLMAGHAASSTAMVKWMALDPYLDREAVIAGTLDNLTLLVTDLLHGGPWTWLFLPDGFAWLLAGGIVAMVPLAHARGVRWRALMLAIVIAGTALPTTYSTLLWNRVRYIWPFGFAWMVAVVCLGAGIGALCARIKPIYRIAAPIVMWGCVAYQTQDFGRALDDVATSARAIARQQVALGRWARRELPSDAVIGVNDTGAIAYMSERRTFDVVGLTTEGEARYWAEGAGSRFEHYESLPRERLPSHYIVYPGWMRMSAVLGDALHSATVIDQSILGGDTMIAYRADYALLGSGARPFSVDGSIADALDVADIDSERAHDYRRGDARAAFNVATVAFGAHGAIADGGRLERAEDRFVMAAGGRARLVMRVRCSAPLEVWVGGTRIGEAAVDHHADDWDERSIALPPAGEPRRITVRATAPLRFASWHYWLLDDSGAS